VIDLISVYDDARAESVLYTLLAERPRENWVSHERMPTPEEHHAFFISRPFRYWLLILDAGEPVGAIEALETNELGIAILREHQHKGYAREALQHFLDTWAPLPAIPAKRAGHWLANIAIGNQASKRFFRQMGFQPIQETWRHG
jgi:RimJ/RimL family protein N-acetyltransferase